MQAALEFSPLFDWPIIAALAAASVVFVVLVLLRGGAGWPLRAAAAACLLIALANPSLKQELRDPLSDVAFLVVDESASQSVAPRPEQMAEAEAHLIAELDRLAAAAREGEAPLEYRVVRAETSGDDGTQLLTALEAATASVAPDRIAGALVLSDGQVHDAARLDAFPGPVHLLLSGEEGEWDRRLIVETAPTFGFVGETVFVTFKVEALGEDPPEEALAPAVIEVLVDGRIITRRAVPVGRTVRLEAPIEHGGANVLSINAPPLPGELTDRNNSAVFSVNGVRDRLRVLLISGEPHAGERTWRNLLKADPSVDLVHFTILRPPSKQDGVPVFELSLISFPTRELFLQKINEFDLIIFDRYRRRGVLPNAYIQNVSDYVDQGGAVLVASGPAFAGVESLFRTPLNTILPARPTARILEEGYQPMVTETGRRHPVTGGLSPSEEPDWGRWFRQIEMQQISGHTVMSGVDDKPLLILDRVGEGRVAALASDHAWLWSRGFEGGGPQAELLRRLAHWLMKEPELEEEALTAESDGRTLIARRRSVTETPKDLTVIAPSGDSVTVPFVEEGPGLWRAEAPVSEQGLFTLTDGVIETVAAIGPPSPKEFENPVSTSDVLAPLITATGGRVIRVADATPDLRRVREGRPAAGRGWFGLNRREAYSVRDIRLTPLAPGWLMLVLSGLLLVTAWRIEGR